MDEAQLAQLTDDYRRDGFVAVEGLLSADEVSALKAEAAALARGERGPLIGALTGAQRSDDETLGDVLAIHFPHKASDAIRAAMVHPRIVQILAGLIGPDVKAMQTMLFVKRAGKPGQAWHQDEHYIPTRDRSLCGAWIALDDATIENGCLWMLPGSHAKGVLWPTRTHSDPRFDPSEEAFGFGLDPEGGVPVELKAGGIAFFNGYVLHRSLPNRSSAGFRRALVTHYMSATSLLPWNVDGRLSGREDFRDIVMICGDDPYEWRGLEDLTAPFVRPENPRRFATVFGEVAERMRQAGS